jgi:hypothetical protein
MSTDDDPWAIDAACYPPTGEAEQLRFLVGYAVLAPSSHNTQPWQFRVAAERVEVWSDPMRFLPRIDPDRRQLFMSCGAALFNLRIAMRRFGNDAEVERLPDPRRPDLLAVVTRGPTRDPDTRDLALFNAIPRRRTNRERFLERPIGHDLGEEIMAEAVHEGAWMERLHPHDKLDVADAISDADLRQYADDAYRRELARWLVPRGSDRRDGVPMVKRKAELLTTLPIAGPLAVRNLDRGPEISDREAELTIDAPMVGVLGTEEDDPLAWLIAGEALQAVFLRATSSGVAMSFLNQVVEDPALRRRIAEATGRDGFPQLVLRFGFGPTQPATPRRPVADVLRR